MSNLKERAEELFKIMVEEAPVNFTEGQKPYILELSKRYAEEVIKEASEMVTMTNEDYFCDCGREHTDWNTDKQSILKLIEEL